MDTTLDFEGPTLVMPEAPSVPAGWNRVITDTIDQGAFRHGQYPGYVRVEHMHDAGAKSGDALLRISVQGADAKLVTNDKFLLDRHFSYILSGYYRYILPAGNRIDQTRENSLLRLSLVFFDKDGKEVPTSMFARAIQLIPPGDDWQAFPEVPMTSVPEAAVSFRVVIELTARDYHGHVDVDALSVVRRPYMSVSGISPSAGIDVPSINIDASGLPAGRPIDLHLAVRDFRGDVVKETLNPVNTSSSESSGERELHLVVPLEGVGYGRFEVSATLLSGTEMITSGRTIVERSARPPADTSGRIGLVLTPRPGEDPPSGLVARGFAIVEVPLSWGEDASKLKALSSWLRHLSLVRRYLWIRLDERVPASVIDARLTGLVQVASNSVNAWLIDDSIPKALASGIIESGGARREILTVGPGGQVTAISAQKINDLPEAPLPGDLVILSIPADQSTPDVLWSLAELRVRGATRVALRLPDDTGSLSWMNGAISYWADRIMDADYEGGSGIAADVATLLFSEQGRGLLLYRSLSGRKDFSATLGNRLGLTVVDLVGNRFLLSDVQSQAVQNTLDVSLNAEPFTRAVEGVDLGLLKTSMSVKIDSGSRIMSSFSYQEFNVSLTNFSKEPLTLRLSPRGASGWRFKPSITTPPQVLQPGETGSFTFDVRPSFLSSPGANLVGIEVFPQWETLNQRASLAGTGSFTVWKDVDLYSPISVSLKILPLEHDRMALNVEAALDKAYGVPATGLSVSLRYGDHTMRTVINGLVPGGSSRGLSPFILPMISQPFPIEVWINDTNEGLFYNGRFIINPADSL
jgi:hypothetical protein